MVQLVKNKGFRDGLNSSAHHSGQNLITMMMHFVVDNNNSTYCFIRTQKFSQRNKYKNEDYKKRSENSHLETAKANREKWLGH